MLTFNGTFTQTAGTTRLNGGGLAGVAPLQFDGGQLIGVGLITGSIINGATVRPGASPGKLTITGAYTQTATGALAIELGGATRETQFDWLAVGGAAHLDGILEVELINGFSPALNALFTFLTCGSRTGTFASLDIPNPFGMRVNYAATSATLEVISISEPDRIEILHITLANPGVRIEWSAVGGSSYLVQAANALTGIPGDFQDISPVIVAPGNGPATASFVDNSIAQASRFYRVRLAP